MLKFCLQLLLISHVTSEKVRFDNYSLYKVLPKNENDIILLQDLAFNHIEYDFWTEPVPSAEYINIMASPPQKTALEAFLNFYDIDYNVSMKNVQE